MATATMPRQKGDRASKPKPDEFGGGDDPKEGVEGAKEDVKEKEVSLKVGQEDGQLVGKIAAHRNVSVKKLFRMQDVHDFFAHLLLEEMRLEAERLNKRKQ